MESGSEKDPVLTNSGNAAETTQPEHFARSSLLVVLGVRFSSSILGMVVIGGLMPAFPSPVPAQSQRIVIGASTLLDGKGHTLHDARIVIEGSKIVAIEPSAARPVDYDLSGLTVLPGWIDAHVHITWIFGKDGKNAGAAGTSQEDAYRSASNAWVTLMAGFTTVQSVGSPNDVPLRDAIAKGLLPGRAFSPPSSRW